MNIKSDTYEVIRSTASISFDRFMAFVPPVLQSEGPAPDGCVRIPLHMPVELFKARLEVLRQDHAIFDSNQKRNTGHAIRYITMSPKVLFELMLEDRRRSPAVQRAVRNR